MHDADAEKFDERVLGFQCVGPVHFIPEEAPVTMKLEFVTCRKSATVVLLSVNSRIGVEHALWQHDEEPLVRRLDEEKFYSRADVEDMGSNAQIVLHGNRLTLVEFKQESYVRVVGEWIWRSKGPKRSRTKRWTFEGLLKAQPSEPCPLDERLEHQVAHMLKNWPEVAL